MSDLPTEGTSSNQSTKTLPNFARLLGKSASTVKRLFEREILPQWLVTRIPGKHWRVCFTERDLQTCRAALVLWSVWYRKPDASKRSERQNEFERLLFDWALNSAGLLDMNPPEAHQEMRQRLLRPADSNPLLNNSFNEQLRKKFLANPTEETASRMILRLAVNQITARREMARREMARREMASSEMASSDTASSDTASSDTASSEMASSDTASRRHGKQRKAAYPQSARPLPSHVGMFALQAAVRKKCRGICLSGACE